MNIKNVLSLLYGIKNFIHNRLQKNAKHVDYDYVVRDKINYSLKYSHRKQKELKNKKIQLADSFFNENTPCPPEIKNCEQLRKIFFLEKQKLTNYKICSDCQINTLKSIIIEKFDVDLIN